MYNRSHIGAGCTEGAYRRVTCPLLLGLRYNVASTPLHHHHHSAEFLTTTLHVSPQRCMDNIRESYPTPPCPTYNLRLSCLPYASCPTFLAYSTPPFPTLCHTHPTYKSHTHRRSSIPNRGSKLTPVHMSTAAPKSMILTCR